MTKFEQFLTEAQNKYKGTYNWYQENHILYTSAPSEVSAHRNMLSQLAKKLNRNVGLVSNHFKSNNYKVEKIHE
jgi:hypothetical protein